MFDRLQASKDVMKKLNELLSDPDVVGGITKTLMNMGTKEEAMSRETRR